MLAHDFCRAFLIFRERIGMQETNDNTVKTGIVELTSQFFNRRFIQRHMNAAIGKPALRDFKPHAALNQNRRVVKMHVIDGWPCLPANLYQVTKPL